MNTPIKVLDLFAGAGGLTAGFHAASPRFITVRAVEMDQTAAASFEATFGRGIVYAGSIQSWLETDDVPQADIVIGGPPCQGFSTLGKQDDEDERNKLWEYYKATILRVRPKYFVVENVARFRESRQYADFVEATEPDGDLHEYAFKSAILNAADFGAAQARKRAVLIGHRRDLPFPGFPTPTHVGAHRTVEDEIGSVSPEVDGIDLIDRSMAYNGKELAGPYSARELHLGRRYQQLSLDRITSIPVNGNRFNIPEDLLPQCWKKHKTGAADVMGRLNWKKPSVTIRTEFFKPEKGRYLHPVAHRAITHYEAALLQGFPETHRFVGSKTAIARQIGNAVPIPLGSAIAGQLLKRL